VLITIFITLLGTMIQLKFVRSFKTNKFDKLVKDSSYLTISGIYLYRNERDDCGKYISHRLRSVVVTRSRRRHAGEMV
jgi:hypothetical protein